MNDGNAISDMDVRGESEVSAQMDVPAQTDVPAAPDTEVSAEARSAASGDPAVAEAEVVADTVPSAGVAAGVRPSVSRRLRYATLAAGAVFVAGGTAAELWFAPFAFGAFLGAVGMVRGLRSRTALWCAAAAAPLGWSVPLLERAAAGEAVVSTARVAGAMAGLPAVGWLFIVVTLLVAGLQGMMGAWLGRSLAGPFVRRRHRKLGEAATLVS
jgi:hypothetical protein